MQLVAATARNSTYHDKKVCFNHSMRPPPASYVCTRVNVVVISRAPPQYLWRSLPIDRKSAFFLWATKLDTKSKLSLALVPQARRRDATVGILVLEYSVRMQEIR